MIDILMIIGATMLIVLVGITIIYILYTKKREEQTREMVEEYIRMFPDRCMVCHYHKFGVDNGLTTDEKPQEHDCIHK